MLSTNYVLYKISLQINPHRLSAVEKSLSLRFTFPKPGKINFKLQGKVFKRQIGCQ